MVKLIGPFSELLTMRDIGLKGPAIDDQMEIISDAAVVFDYGVILEVGKFDQLLPKYQNCEIEQITQAAVVLPGFIDAHTHICFAGTRSKDYQMRCLGKSYLEIAKSGGGIWSTVEKTREASLEELAKLIALRANRHIKEGVTTIEVKSGYGLNVKEELKILSAIKSAANFTKADLIPTCLAAHIKPRDFSGSNVEYLQYLSKNLLPIILSENLAKRVDIFIEQTAFSSEDAVDYLEIAKKMGFDLTIHADQFSVGGSNLAVKIGAVSADHLEASSDQEIAILGASDVVAIALPGSSLGLGINKLTPARKLLDNGAILAIASDWNPGSAPMGDLLMQAAILGIYEKLSAAEIFSALTFRAAKALNLKDRGRISPGMCADMQLYPFSDYREILYNQGKIKPFAVYKSGHKIINLDNQ
jgi:imidazolonepropionase